MCNCNKCSNQLKSDFSTDLEILDKILFYFVTLRPLLPCSRLSDHCAGALASTFELLFFLKKNNLTDYGNNEK